MTDGTALGEYDRYNMQRMLTLSANIHGEDLGRAAARVQQAINGTGKPPDRVNVTVRGQVEPMAEMFGGLRRSGLLMAVGVILLLLTANFQSVRLSLAVGSTIPAVIAGVALMLWLTRTTLNIQSFMGAIMAIGVAVANAILLVTFAERSRIEGREPWEAAIEGARSRLRPILMTSFAMLAGMMPMALGLGEGGEQSAPLGRAVIGGLLGATCATLIILPAILAALQSRRARFRPRSILTTPRAAISSRSHGSVRFRTEGMGPLNTMLGRRNRRAARTDFERRNSMNFTSSNGHQGLGSCHRRRRGGHRCRLAFGSIAIAVARESVEAG